MTSNNLFINNTYVAGKDFSIGVDVSGNGIAPYTGPNVGYFIGVLDEIRVYNRALTDVEIDSLYNNYATSIDIPINTISKNFELHQNYPNPFNPNTTIGYNLPQTSDIRIEVFNIEGQRMATLVDERKPTGYHTIDFKGNRLASGVYLYRIQAGDYIETKKMILIR